MINLERKLGDKSYRRIVIEARKAILITLLNLSKEEPNNPNKYYTPYFIANKVPKNHNSYGVITSRDVILLLKDYMDKELVLRVEIKSGIRKDNIGYSINPKKIKKF
jgi:hypothetical protein|tara:strand:+ start:184 stop:504 length:321 start_codon:yes stop_codon:yes gene_type:complete